MIRVLVADDEQLARQRLERLAGSLPDVEVVAVCASADEVLEAIRDDPVDLALLDIDMPGLSGLDVAALISDGGPRVAFVTAHPEHAVAAFAVGAIDYLLKPVDVERLARAIDRVRTTAESVAGDPIAIPTARGIRLIRPDDITHALIDGETVEIHSAGGVFFTALSLNDLERRLPSTRFVRVHRRVLVALDAVDLLEPTEDGGYTARIRTGATVRVSRASARGLRRRLGIFKGS